MKFSFIFPLILCFSTLSSFGQTKLIAHKSHGGTNQNFNSVLESSIFDLSGSNFGQAPEILVRTARLDTIMFLNDTSAVMITSHYCKEHYSLSNQASFWEPGKDTVHHHPLFSKKNTLDEIKATLAEDYYFRNPPETVVFIGHSNEEKTQKKNKIYPVIKDQKLPPQAPLGLCFILLFSIVMRFSHPKRTLVKAVVDDH